MKPEIKKDSDGKLTLMIHEIREDHFLELPLKEYTLTFDDGLYRQYALWDHIKKIDTNKIFFISSGIINPVNKKQSKNFPTSREAHQKFFDFGVTEDFMNIEQIKFLSEQEQVSIGAHGYAHTNIKDITSFSKQIDFIKRDTEKLLEWFDKNMSFKPTEFCFPYNESNEIYIALLKGYGFKEFYEGWNRLDIGKISLF